MAHSSRTQRNNARYARLAERIYKFTSAIYKTRLQPPLRHPKTRLKSRRDRNWLQAYQHIATLLSRDAQDCRNIIVTGGPRVGNVCTISVISLQPSAGTFPRFRVDAVLESSEDFHHDLGTECDLTCHVRDIFRALVVATSSENVTEAYTNLLAFWLKRSWSCLRDRVAAGTYLLRSDLVSILSSWVPEPSDGISPTGVPVPVFSNGLALLLMNEDVPASPASFGTSFLYSRETEFTWLKVLCTVLSSLFKIVNQVQPSDEAIFNLVAQMDLLAALLGCYAIRKTFSKPSLEQHLTQYAHEPYGMQTTSPLQEFVQDPLRLSSLLDDEKIDERETTSAQVFRYLESLLAPFRACLFLTNWIARLGPHLPLVNVVYISPSQELLPCKAPSTPQPVEYEVLDEIVVNFPLTDEEEGLLKAAVEELFHSSSLEFDEKLACNSHVEAFAGALTYASEKVPPWNRLLEVSNREMGLPYRRTCCYCCNMLLEALFEGDEARIHRHQEAMAFSLPGFLVPWNPPPRSCGIPLEVLEDMEEEVRFLLRRTLEEYLDPLIHHLLQAPQ